MKEVSNKLYRRCPNCGKLYVPKQSTDAYCSPECVERYDRCSTCGRFFPTGTGNDVGMCSEVCSQVYVVKGNTEKTV